MLYLLASLVYYPSKDFRDAKKLGSETNIYDAILTPNRGALTLGPNGLVAHPNENENRVLFPTTYAQLVHSSPRFVAGSIAVQEDGDGFAFLVNQGDGYTGLFYAR